MKNITLAGAAIVMAISVGSASAAPTAGSFGINVDLTSPATPLGTPSVFMVKGRYLVAKDMAVQAGVGFQMNDNGAATNNTSNSIGFMGGIRKYLKTDDFSPFVGGRLQYLSIGQGVRDVIDFALMAEVGAEYFIGKQFSLEGSVGGGYDSATYKFVGATVSTKSTSFGTTTYNVSANYYF